MSQAFLIFEAVIAVERPEKTGFLCERIFLEEGLMLTEEQLQLRGHWIILVT
jgi:hypothetical protein